MQNIGQKKILVIYASGSQFTIRSFKNWLNNFFELQFMASITPHFLENNADNIWKTAQNIALVIKDKYEKFDGFVVINSLDSLIFVSAMLSFMIQNTGKPIIFTAPSVPEDGGLSKKNLLKSLPLKSFEDLAFKSNIINSVQIATMDIAEIGVSLGNHLVRAAGVKYGWNSPALSAQNFKDDVLARFQFGITLLANVKKRSPKAPDFKTAFNEKIKYLEYHQGISELPQAANYEGIFIKTNSRLIDFKGSGKTVIAMHTPKTDIKTNDAILCRERSWEVALAKFVWAMGQSREYPKIKKIMAQNLAGEF